MEHSIGKTIAKLRKGKGWTQAELAEKLQVSDKAISKWEQDNGAPSIEFFPALAELFGVSVDYLMTGKEKEVANVSKMELCAKNDDVALFKTLAENIVQYPDENGKTILDYILEYRSEKVAVAFFEKYPARRVMKREYPHFKEETVLTLLIKMGMVKELEGLDAFKIDSYGKRCLRSRSGVKFYEGKYRELILSDPSVSEELKRTYYQNATAKEIAEFFEFLLERKNREEVNFLWSVVREINERNIAKKEEKSKERLPQGYFVSFSSTPCEECTSNGYGRGASYRFFVVHLPVALLKSLLDNGYIEIVKEANAFNKRIGAATVNEEKILYAEHKKKGDMSEEELNVLSVTNSGVIVIEELLEFKDLSFIKKVLNEYPVHIVETLYGWLCKEQWKELFRYAVDYNETSLTNYIIDYTANKEKETKTRIEQAIANKWNGNSMNDKYLSLRKKDGTADTYAKGRKAKDGLQAVVEYIAACKQQVLDDLVVESDKEKIVGELTKEYFESELAKGNREMVIIKLCVLLEAILRCCYHYEGELAEMLHAYCSEYGWEYDDDYDSSREKEFVKYLHKLRKCRNGIVHSEKTDEEMTEEEIRFCIDYIFKMD